MEDQLAEFFDVDLFEVGELGQMQFDDVGVGDVAEGDEFVGDGAGGEAVGVDDDSGVLWAEGSGVAGEREEDQHTDAEAGWLAHGVHGSGSWGGSVGSRALSE